jgi:CDGSH-type Zn-finger protein
MASANVSARVAISKDGPYLVTGSPPLSRQTITTDSDGGSERWHEGETFAVQKNYALCRCGHSKTSHFATARTPRSDLMAPRRQVVNPTQSRRRLSMALWCHSRTQRAFVQRDDYDGRLPTIKLAKSGSRRVARIELPV